MKKKGIIIALTVAIIVTVLLLVHMPERIKGTMSVSTGNGETVEVAIDILYFSNLVLPSYVKGTLTVDGIEYIDQYTKFKEFTGVSDNRLFPSDWWEAKGSFPYNMTFIKSDCTDIISAVLNQIKVVDIVLDKGVSKIHYMYHDEKNQIGSTIHGISFWGPAHNAEEAKQIAESFGYQIPDASETLADYLGKYATDTFEGDYVKLDAVEGLSYVYNEYVSDIEEVSGSVVTIYNQGIRCGSFDMIELPEGGLQNQSQLMQFHAWRSSHGSVELQAQEMIEGVVRYKFLVSDLPYSYGDTEWLIEAGLFADTEEASKESYEDVDVLWSKEGAEQGYWFTVNKALISERALAQLIEAVSFKEGAFEDTNMDKPLWAQGGVPSFKEERREIFTIENASRLAYEIKHGEATYRVPEHTIALRVDEDIWEVYSYEDTLIGTITLSDDESNPFEVNIMDFSE